MKVHSMGKVTGDDTIAKIYNSADVFVAPSREDNLPNTVLEAMACGIPVVAFRIGGMPDMVEHHKTGYLAEPFDIASFARGIAYALNEVSPQEVRQRAERDYAIERQGTDYMAIYQKMLGQA
jgi:glycosyltransferase involved in cell wall biosynthesis